MPLQSLVIISVAALASAAPGVTATIPLVPPPAATQSKPLPPPLTSALKSFAERAAEGNLPGLKHWPQSAQPSPKVCSIPLVEALPRQARPKDRMPQMPAHSLDHNQVPPPAPPCTADNRIRSKAPGRRFHGPVSGYIPLESTPGAAVQPAK
jgi:hypothetical protein